MTRVLRIGFAIALSVFLSTAAFASSDDVVRNTERPDVLYAGIDLWSTPADSTTFTTFREDPIPADFFCQGSESFTGTIAFKGGGLTTVPEGILGEADTIVERLDDAVFDREGVAWTRVQIRALHLVSLQPIQTECGAFDVTMRLDGPQQTTEMRIDLTQELGGSYSNVLAVTAKLTFTRNDGLSRELTQGVEFAKHVGVWAVRPGVSKAPVRDYAKVDVDGDGNAETVIPGPSNFVAGATLADGVLAKPSRERYELAVAEEVVACPVVNSPVFSSVAQVARQNCHCDPSSGTGGGAWNINANCFNWNTSGCAHLHCRSNPGVLIQVDDAVGIGESGSN